MKLIETEDKGFTPFRMTLEFETVEEARLMWHVFNRGKLQEAIFTNYGSYYCQTTNREFASPIIRHYIERHIGEVT